MFMLLFKLVSGRIMFKVNHRDSQELIMYPFEGLKSDVTYHGCSFVQTYNHCLGSRYVSKLFFHVEINIVIINNFCVITI